MKNILKVVSWNVHYPSFAENNQYVVNTLQELGEFDVICIQEYVEGGDDTTKKWLKDNDYIIDRFILAKKDKFNDGLLTAVKSRLAPVTKKVTLREDEPKDGKAFSRFRGLLDTEIKFGGSTLSVVNTHLTAPRSYTIKMRQTEFENLNKHIRSLEDANAPLLLCGDFNFLPVDKRRSYLKKNYSSFSGNKISKTWRHESKYSPIRGNLDYVFWNLHDNSLKIETKLADFNRSDHRPIVITLSK